MTDCAERKRLQEAYHQWHAAAYALEDELSKTLTSGNQNQIRQARKRLEKANRKWYHLLQELNAHEKTHGCSR